jgi:AcrR family transcriptional regulator
MTTDQILPVPRLAEPVQDKTETTLPRRAPVQQRSRERMDRILSVASALIGSKGSDQLKMAEVAEHAGVSIGSLYQYFPDKSAIIRSLAARYSQESRRCIEEALAPVTSLAKLEEAYGRLLDLYHALFKAEPVMRDIWSGMQADKQLMALEFAESRYCGMILAKAMARAHGSADAAIYAPRALMIWQLGEAAMRLAISLEEKEGDAIVSAFRTMTLREIGTP